MTAIAARVSAGTHGGRSRPVRRTRSARLDLWIVLLATFFYTQSRASADLFIGGRMPPSAESSGALVKTAAGETMDAVRMPVFLLLLGVVILRNLSTRRGSFRPLAIHLIFCFTIQLTSFIATATLDTSARWWLLPVLGLAIWMTNPKPMDMAVLGQAAMVVAVFSIGLALVDPDRAFMMLNEFLEDTNKAVIGDQQLAGPFSQMNLLGMSMAVGFPFVFLFRNRFVRWGSAGVVFYTLLWSASRTSALALLITMAFTVVIFAFRSNVTRRRLFGIAALVMAAVVVVLPLRTSDPTSFTNRGAIWIRSIERWIENPLFGFGTTAYGPGTPLAKAIGYPSWHGHNLFVSGFTMGGAVLAIMLAVLIASAWRSASRMARETLVPAVYVVLIVSLGMTEVALRIDDYDGVGWISWPALLIILCATSRPTAVPVTEAPSTITVAPGVQPVLRGGPRAGRHSAAV